MPWALLGTHQLFRGGNLLWAVLAAVALAMQLATDVRITLYTAYLLKEELRMFWAMGDETTAEIVLNNWLEEARASGLKHFEKLAETIDKNRGGLLSYFQHRISTGPLEGMNNKIKVLKRQAYGFRDNAYFKLRLYFIHEATPAFPG